MDGVVDFRELVRADGVDVADGAGDFFAAAGAELLMALAVLKPAAVKRTSSAMTFSTGSLRCLALSIWLTRPLSERMYIMAPYMHSRRH